MTRSSASTAIIANGEALMIASSTAESYTLSYRQNKEI
jgi:hypothetical protein